MSEFRCSDLQVREAVARGVGVAMRQACPVEAVECLPVEWMELLAKIDAQTAAVANLLAPAARM